MGAEPVVEFGIREGGGARSWRVSFPAMGTRVDLTGVGGDLQRITREACCTAADLEALWSVFRQDSDISRINARQGWCEVDPWTDSLLADAVALTAATGGAFTPLAGALVRLWDVRGAREEFLASSKVSATPSEEDLREAISLCDPAFLHRDSRGRWRIDGSEVDGGCTSSRPGIDLGGIAKGAAADAVRDVVIEAGAQGVLVSFGTSSIASFGQREDGRPWRVGLRDAGLGETEWCGHVELGTASLSTSGDYAMKEHVVEGEAEVVRGLRRHPAFRGGTFDPRTGMPVSSGVVQASVVCESGVMAEALSTAILVGGPSCVNEARLGVWARARGVSACWESVVVGESGVEASPGAGWRPRRPRSVGGGENLRH